MTDPAPAARQELDRRIREAIVSAMEAGDPIDRDRLHEQFPADPEAVERQIATAREYLRQRAEVVADSPAVAACRRPGAGPGVAERLLVGTRLGDFEVQAHLADGGMGSVYRARQLSLGGRTVALKVMAWDGGAGARARFQREVLSLADVHHPHLAEVYGFGEQGGLLHYAMELVPGPTLREVLAHWRDLERPPGSRPALRRAIVSWGAQVSAALTAMHRADLVHRDVKPSNIIVRGLQPDGLSKLDASDSLDAWQTSVSPVNKSGSSGEAVLIDFGLVKPLGPTDATWTAAGAASRAYAPPEQLIGRKVGPSADVFSLGVTMFELFVGRGADQRPQASLGMPRLDDEIDGFDADLAAIVAKAVEPSERWRYADAEELLTELHAWQKGLEVAARRPPLAERIVRTVRRKPRVFAVRAALIIATCLAIVGTMSAISRREDMRGIVRASYAGDLLTTVEGLDALRGWSWLGLGLNGFDHARREVWQGGAVTASIAAALRLGDRNAARLYAVTALTHDGYVERPLLLRLLAWMLSQEAHGPTELAHSRSAVASVARLVTDRPVQTPAEVDAVAPLVKAIRSLWRRADLSSGMRLNLACSLAGCGTTADLLPMLAWTLSHEPGQEAYRLGMMCIGHILDRSHSGLLGELPPAGAWAQLEAECAERFSEPRWASEDQRWVIWNLQHGLLSVAVARLLAYRAAGVTIDPRRSLPPGWIDALERSVPGNRGGGPVGNVGDAPRLFAAAGDSLAAEWLASAAPRTADWPAQPPFDHHGAPWGSWSTQWGVMCGMLGNDQVTARARRRIELATSLEGAVPTSAGARAAALGQAGALPVDLYQFSRGVEQGDAARHGVRSGAQPIAASMPRARPSPVARDIAGSVTTPALGKPRRVAMQVERWPDSSAVDIPPFDLILNELSPSTAGPVAAAWSFRKRPVVVAAGATGVEITGAMHDPDDRVGYLMKVVEFGHGSVRLSFRLEKSPPPLRLLLRHQGAARWYMPYSGRVILETSLDGEFVDRRRIDNHSIHETAIEIPETLAIPGDHVLTLRLHEDSTTTWWLHHAWLDSP